jgi:hypothetical protein
MRAYSTPRMSISCSVLAIVTMSSAASAADSVEVLENYSPVRVAIPGQPGQFYYQSPSFTAYRDNVMQGLIQGLTAFGPEGSPTRFEAFDKNVYSVFETTGTPFNSWLGDTSPSGAYAGEFGTHVRASVRVHSDTPFTIDDVLYSYVDDQGTNFSRTFGALNFSFSSTFVGKTAGGDLLDSAADARLQPIVALYFFGFTNINVNGRQTPAHFAASGQSFRDFYGTIDQLYVNDPYTFRDSYALIRNGQTVAIDALAGDIVQGIPEPQSWALMIAGFGLAGAGIRRARVTTPRYA